MMNFFRIFAICLAGLALRVQGATPQLLTPTATSDGAVQIGWVSEAGAVYTIESADSLETGDAPVVRWIARETEYPTQGSVTKWMDVGDPGWSPRIFHPRLSGTRFYRIIKTGAATLPSPSISFSIYQNNILVPTSQTSVQDFIEIRYTVSMGVPADLLGEVLVLVDGQVVKRAYDLTGSAFVNTSEWPNGQHSIQVVARTTDATDTTPSTSTEANDGDVKIGVGASAVRNITFDPYISEFFVATPFFQPEVHGYQEIVARFKEDSYWQLYVLAGDNSVVDGYEGQAASLYVAWDGTDFNTNALPDGSYDYYIVARPTRLGPFQTGTMAASSISTSSGASTPVPGVDGSDSDSEHRHFRRLPPNQAQKGQKGLIQSVAIRSAAQIAVTTTTGFGRTSDVIVPPEDRYSGSLLPVISTNTVPSGDPPIPPGAMSAMAVGDESTSTPLRIPGQTFKGFAGIFGVGYQSHHVSWLDVGFFSMPTGGSGFTSTWAPFGRLRNAAAIGNRFSTQMTSAGWRRAFMLSDDSFRWYDLAGCYTGDCDQEYNPPALFGGSFGQGCEIGLLVGHMVAASNSKFSSAVSYFPFWNPKDASPLGGTLRSYNWVALPEMDFGQSATVIGNTAPLKWMGLWGCNSLRVTDVDDMWTKFLLPFPPNLRVLLGTDTSVYIVPELGSRFANNMNGVSQASQGVPMTVVDSWYNAGTVAHQIAATTRNPLKRPGQVSLTSVYRKGGDGIASTRADTIWNYPSNISRDYIDIEWESSVVYTP